MTWRVIHADCVEAMRELGESSVDAIVTDPPYEIAFMAREWDRRGVAFDPGTWREALRVLKPGGHLLSFGGTRTYHRLACALEDAGFEIRDCLAWLYGSGFPKSLDVSKAIDKAAGAAREVVGHRITGAAMTAKKGNGATDFGSGQNLVADTAPATPDAERWQGWGTALKPAFEPIVLARKPLSGTVAQNVLEHGTGALNIDGTRVEMSEQDAETIRNAGGFMKAGWDKPATPIYEANSADHPMPTVDAQPHPAGRWPANVLLDEAWEPVLCLRYSLSDDAWNLLSEWCDARHGDVPDVRGPDRRPAEPGEAPEVLLAGLPESVDVGAPTGRGAPDDGAPPLPGVHREDAAGEAGNGQARPGQSALEGFLDSSGLRDGESAGGPSDPGASAGDGAGTRTATRARRGRASRQRDQVGQPTGEPSPGVERRAHAGASAGLRRAPTAPRPRREVLLRDVPEAWLTYFEFTGDVARIGSAEMLDEQSGETRSRVGSPRSGTNGEGWGMTATGAEYADAGGASRFFYTAKTSRAERERGVEAYFPDKGEAPLLWSSGEQSPGTFQAEGTHRAARNHHPTVKPVDLMQWLCRLITPPNGLILDPFLGSGSTGIAALREGFDFIGIEKEAEYVEIARARIIGDAPLLNVGEEVIAEQTGTAGDPPHSGGQRTYGGAK